MKYSSSRALIINDIALKEKKVLISIRDSSSICCVIQFLAFWRGLRKEICDFNAAFYENIKGSKFFVESQYLHVTYVIGCTAVFAC